MIKPAENFLKDLVFFSIKANEDCDNEVFVKPRKWFRKIFLYIFNNLNTVLPYNKVNVHKTK